MQSAKNRMKVLSALSMAAAATFAAKSANAASLSLYYGNTAGTAVGSNTSNASSDGIWVGNSVGPTFTGPTQFKTAKGNLQGTPTQITPNQGTPTTITVPEGQYLSISINALLTGNTNGDGGLKEVTTKGGTVTEPSNLGLSALGIRIPVSANDANGALLQPVNLGKSYTTFNSTPGFNSYAIVNTVTSTPGGPAVPQWAGGITPGDVEASSGSVGANNQIFGGNKTPASTASESAELQQFSASSAAYGNSTEFFEGLVYQAGSSSGVVTLSPFADSTATQYWSVLTPASGAKKGVDQTPTTYQPSYFGSSDTIGTLPVLVIDVVGTGPTTSSHAILSLTSAAPTAYGTSSGTLAVSGSNGKYTLAQITGLSDVTNYVEATGWNPATDEEIYGLDVLVNGNAASGAQLATLINAINGDSSLDGASAGVSASTTPVGGFPSSYNLFLTYAAGGTNPDFLGVDLSSTNDSNLVGYSFSEVAAVPEPMTIGLLAVGGVGLMARRSRRKA
jgi:hypothetical protein